MKSSVSIWSRTGELARATRSIKKAVLASDSCSKAGRIISNLVIYGLHSESMPTMSLPVSDRSCSQSDSLPINLMLMCAGSLRHSFDDVGPN